MSQENVEVVRRVFDYFNQTGEAGPLDLYDPQVTFTTRGEVEGPTTFTGHRGMADGVASFGEAWAETAAHVIALIPGDDVVVAVVRFDLRSHEGAELEVEEGWAYWLRDGKLTQIEQHGSREQALEAAGLSELAMSQEDVEVARRSLEAVKRGDFEAALQDAAPDFEYDLSRAVGPWRGVYGRDGALSMIRDIVESWEWVRVEPHERIEVGEHVVTPWTMRGAGRDGIEVEARFTWLTTIRDGLIVRISLHQEREEALEAAGLSE